MTRKKENVETVYEKKNSKIAHDYFVYRLAQTIFSHISKEKSLGEIVLTVHLKCIYTIFLPSSCLRRFY